MRYVVGIVRASDLNRVRRALGRAGIHRLTVGEVEVLSTGSESPPDESERSLRLEIAVNDEFLAPALEAFREVRGGEEGSEESGGVDRDGGDGCVSVLPLEDVLRIRTGERGRSAI